MCVVVGGLTASMCSRTAGDDKKEGGNRELLSLVCLVAEKRSS